MAIKRIIEVEEVKINGKKYYKALGCNTLFFDEKGLESITSPVNEIHPTPVNNPLNCKFVVVDNDGSDTMTTGKIYTVVNGRFRDDLESRYPICQGVSTFEQLAEYISCGKGDFHYSSKVIKIIEVIE